MALFKNRSEAGKLLAKKLDTLQSLKAESGVIVLALPRGGLPVAYEVAETLAVPLDVFTVRKLGVPDHAELAFGAIASGGIQVLNQDVIDSCSVTGHEIAAVTRREEQELARRELCYRAGRQPLSVHHRYVILVDDGLATGSTMRAAIRALRRQEPKGIMVAVPVAPLATCRDLRNEADHVICLHTPDPFVGVGAHYEDFSQTTDDEVREYLQAAAPKILDGQGFKPSLAPADGCAASSPARGRLCHQ